MGAFSGGVIEVAMLALLTGTGVRADALSWVVVRSPHFEVYSQAGPEEAQAAVQRFEELHSFFAQSGLVGLGDARPEDQSRVRVIGFRSERQYNAFRLRPTADAFYVGNGDRNYIVMPALERREFRVAAHEYAHFVLHASGLKLPLWLSEGWAEVFSTIRIDDRTSQVGGELRTHTNTLQHHDWLPLPDLLSYRNGSDLPANRQNVSIFYAESWALTDMLLADPGYASHFPQLIALLRLRVPSADALGKVFGRSLDSILRDLRAYVAAKQFHAIALPPVALSRFAIEVASLSEFDGNALLADLLLTDGADGRAEELYQQLLRQSPENANILAPLGTLALRRGDRNAAISYWRKAIDAGQSDASLCYRYALLGEDADLPTDEIRRVLQRAVELNPDFKEARYKLALLESNAGQFEAALGQLKSMGEPSSARSFDYWCVTAYALTETGKRKEAEEAAGKAMTFAKTSGERARASDLAYMAETDLTVRFERGPKGELRLATTRVPHGTTEWNPFIEPQDRIAHAEGKLETVECEAGRLTGFSVRTANGPLQLSVPDPMHVLMRNSPAEFSCGAQSAQTVEVEFAAAQNGGAAILRGMKFR